MKKKLSEKNIFMLKYAQQDWNRDKWIEKVKRILEEESYQCKRI